MKNTLKMGAAFLFLTAPLWCGATSLNIPDLCHGLVDDPANRIYVGQFGEGDGTLDTALVVTPNRNSRGEVVVFYVWGDSPQGTFEAGCVRRKGVEEGNELAVRLPRMARVTYEFQGDDASVKFVRNAETTHGRVSLSSAAMTVREQPSGESEAAETASSAPTIQSSEVKAALVDSVYEGEWREGFLYRVTFARGFGKKMKAKVHVIDSDAARTRYDMRARVEIQGPQVRLRFQGLDRVDHLTFHSDEFKLTGFSVYRGDKINRSLWAKRVDEPET